MAASLLPPSFSFNNFGTRQLGLHMRLVQLLKSNYPSVHTQDVRLYREGTAISCSAATGSVELGGMHQGNQASSTILSPNNLPRSVELFNRSRSPPEDVADFEQQLQELFDGIKSMIRMGNVNDAVNLLQANYAYVREQMNEGAKGIEQAAILDILALGYMAVGNFKMVKFLLGMLDDLVDGLRDDEPLLDSLLTHMGSMYAAMGKSEKSMLAYRRSLEILEKEYGSSSIFLVTPLLGTSKVLGSIGRATKAVEVYHRVITILESCKGEESEDLVVPLLGLGNLLMKEKRATDAEKAFIRILNIYTKLYGENDGKVGMAMSSLAHVKCAKGNVDEAIHLYKKALQAIKDSESMTLDDEIMEKMRIDLAELLHSVGRGKEGRELLEECLLITEKYKGQGHPSLVPHLMNLATSYSYSKNFVEAEHLLRMGLQIMEKTLGPDDPSITFPMLHLAVTLHYLNKHEEAEQLALESLCIREKAFGKESLPVGEALDCLVSIQTELGKDGRELLELLNRVLAIQEQTFGYESEEVLQTLKKILFFLDKLGMKEAKVLLQKRLSVLRTKFKNMVQY